MPPLRREVSRSTASLPLRPRPWPRRSRRPAASLTRVGQCEVRHQALQIFTFQRRVVRLRLPLALFVIGSRQRFAHALLTDEHIRAAVRRRLKPGAVLVGCGVVSSLFLRSYMLPAALSSMAYLLLRLLHAPALDEHGSPPGSRSPRTCAIPSSFDLVVDASRGLLAHDFNLRLGPWSAPPRH